MPKILDHLLPKIIILKFISYLTIIPLMFFIFNKFPYDIQEYGSNVELFFSDLISELSMAYSDEISWQLYSAYIGYIDIIIIILLSLIPIWYSLRFWCVEIIVIDQNISIKESLIQSYTLTQHPIRFISLMLLLLGLNIICIVFGYLLFIISLTLSYIIIFLYYKSLLKIL